MHKKKPSLQIMQFEEDENESSPSAFPAASSDGGFDPEALNHAELTDEIEQLKRRREEGKTRIAQMKDQVQRVRRSVSEAEIIRPIPESDEMPSAYAGDAAAIRRRQQQKQDRYVPHDATFRNADASGASESSYGTLDGTGYDRPMTYDDADPSAPVFYDGYTPDAGDEDALTDEEYMPRRTQPVRHEDHFEIRATKEKKKWQRILLKVLLLILTCVLIGVGSVFVARDFVLSKGMQVRENNETTIELTPTEVDGHPAHMLTIYGRENATVYLREMQSTYVIADGKVSVTVPDYMWYDTDSSTFATPVETDTMDVTITPFIRYSQEGDQYQLEPVTFTVDVPLSPVRLLNPTTVRAEVGMSIFEVRINVEKGSTVIIDGTNVSTLIRETGNVSKNVQVLPVGENTISISVKSKYCRENKLEVTLCRAAQEIPLELDATVLVEWNNEPVTEAQYKSITDAEALKKIKLPTLTGTTLPGAKITVEFPHWNLKVDDSTGSFSFIPLFTTLGNNDVVIRASYEGKADSVITHTVYYMPNADIYTRRAWDLSAQYSDLINYITMRKGTIYMGIGTVQRILSTSPQLAIMNIGTDEYEKLVMIENSSKTTWEIGTKYRIYGEAYGLYDTMPRLTVRYTYLVDQ